LRQPTAAARRIMIAHAADRHIDHFGRHFQAAIHRASQRLGLHHRQTQVVPVMLPRGAVIPAAILALRTRNQLERLVEAAIELAIFGSRHAVRLASTNVASPWLYMSR